MGKRVQNFNLKNLETKVINLGYVGENVHTQIVIECSEVLWDYPDAVASMVVQPPRGDLYPVEVTREENNIIWEITASDVVYAGSGRVQLTFTNNGEIVKSAVGTTRISGSIEATGEAPEPLQNWMDQAEETARQMGQDVADATLEDLAETKEECIAEIEQAGADTRATIPADYTQLSDDVTSLKSALNITESGCLPLELVSNSYVKTNGDIETYSGWSRTDYIPCSPNEQIEISFSVDSTYCQWYKSDKTSAGQLKVLSGTHIYTAPSDAEYFIVSHSNANMANLKIRQLAKYSELLDLDDDVKTLKYYRINKDGADSVLVGYIDSTTGAIVSSSSYDVYLFKNIGYESVDCTTTLTTGCGAIAFYSSDEPTADGMLSVIPIKASGVVRSYSENVPSGTKLIAVGNIRSYTAVSISCLLPVEEVYRSAVFGTDIEKSDVATLNKDIEHIVESSSAYNGTDYSKVQHKYFTVLLGSDIHRDVTNYNRMIDYAKQCNVLDAVFVPGDFNASHFNENGFEETYVARYQDLEIPTLLVMGNHDVGDSIRKEVYRSTTPNTPDGCTSRFITPYMSYNGCVQGSGGYYYRDFDDYNIRVIALNEYELPRVDNPNDSSKYLYNYWNRYISQTQADWLVSTLNSVPNGYGVIVLMHQMVDQITEYTDNKFNNPNYVITNGDHMTAQGAIIQDIIDAYITKSTLSKTYANTISAPSADIPDVTVTANFGNASGDFICYVCGHTHADKIGQSSLAAQKQVVEVANTASTTKAYYDDLWRQIGTKSQDCLNLLVFDTDLKRIRILRIGANATLDMEWRDMASVSYAQS